MIERVIWQKRQLTLVQEEKKKKRKCGTICCRKEKCLEWCRQECREIRRNEQNTGNRKKRDSWLAYCGSMGSKVKWDDEIRGGNDRSGGNLDKLGGGFWSNETERGDNVRTGKRGGKVWDKKCYTSKKRRELRIARSLKKKGTYGSTSWEVKINGPYRV